MTILSNTSENAQFSGSEMTFEQCVSYLDKHDVCDDANLYKYISVAGVSTQTGVYSVGATGQYDSDGETVYLTKDTSFPSAIIGVFPDGSLLLNGNSWSSSLEAKTDVLYGQSSSFPVAGEPDLVKQNIPAGSINIFRRGKLISSRHKADWPGLNPKGVCGATYLAIDEFDSSVWVQYAGGPSMWQLKYDSLKNAANRFSTYPYSHPQGSTYAVHKGSLLLQYAFHPFCI
jgi:hypothetical protein